MHIDRNTIVELNAIIKGLEGAVDEYKDGMVQDRATIDGLQVDLIARNSELIERNS